MTNAVNFATNDVGDDQHYSGVDATFPAFCTQVIQSIEVKLLVEKSHPALKDDEIVPPTLRLTPISSEYIHASSDIPKATVLMNQRLSAESHFQDVRNVKLQTNHYDWSAGDVMEVDIQNCESDVERFMRMMEWEDQLYSVKGDKSLPDTITLKELLTRYYTPFAIMKTSGAFLELFSELNPLEKLQELAQNPNEAADYIGKPGRTIAEVLHDFPMMIDPSWIGDLLPRIRPRQYSIAGHDNGVVDLCISLVEYKTILLEPRRGLASRYFASLTSGMKIRPQANQYNHLY